MSSARLLIPACLKLRLKPELRALCVSSIERECVAVVIEPIFKLSGVYQSLASLGLGRSERTFGKWKRVVGIPHWAVDCTRLQAEQLVACAFYRAAHPTAPMTKATILVYLNQNRAEIAARLAGVPRLKPRLDMTASYSWEEVQTFIQQCSTCGARPSLATLRRWVVSMGLYFSKVHPVSASVVHRLIDRADDEAKARVTRGRQLGRRRPMKSA